MGLNFADFNSALGGVRLISQISNSSRGGRRTHFRRLSTISLGYGTYIDLRSVLGSKELRSQAVNHLI